MKNLAPPQILARMQKKGKNISRDRIYSILAAKRYRVLKSIIVPDDIALDRAKLIKALVSFQDLPVGERIDRLDRVNYNRLRLKRAILVLSRKL